MQANVNFLLLIDETDQSGDQTCLAWHSSTARKCDFIGPLGDLDFFTAACMLPMKKKTGHFVS